MTDENKNATAEKIILRSGDVGGRRAIFLLSAWPALALISTELLDGGAPDHIKVGDTAADFTLQLENASAHYRKLSELDGVATLELQPGSTFSEPPEEIAPVPASEDSVSEVGKAASNDDRVSDYDGPAVHEVVLHDGVRKTVLATRASAAGSEISFNKVDYFPVVACEKAE